MIKIPIYDMKCNKCGELKEVLTTSMNEEIRIDKCKCGGEFKKIFPKKAPKFDLVYNPKKDICDWSGNTTRYWEEYNKMKAKGKKPRIPALDGDG